MSPSNIVCTGLSGPGHPVLRHLRQLGALRLGQRWRPSRPPPAWCCGWRQRRCRTRPLRRRRFPAGAARWPPAMQRAPRRPAASRRRAVSGQQQPGPQQLAGRRGSIGEPAAFTATSAATVTPRSQHDRRTADAALEIAGHRAGAGADVPLRQSGPSPRAARVGQRGDAERPRSAGRGSRHPGQGRTMRLPAPAERPRRVRTDLQPDAAVGQLVHHAGAGGQPVSAATGQHHRVDPLHRGRRLEQVGLVGGRSTAADVDPGDHAAFRRQDHRRTGEEAVTDSGVVPDPNTGDIGQSVVRTRFSDFRHKACAGRTRWFWPRLPLCSARNRASSDWSMP